MSDVKIAEKIDTTHEILNIQWEGMDNKSHERWIEIHRDKKGEVISVSLGCKEISAFELDILAFLREKKKL